MKMEVIQMNLIHEKKTKKGLNEAVEALTNNLSENKFGVLSMINFKNKLNDKGLELKGDYVVLEVCNPVQAKKLLDTNIHIGYVLPCKMVVRTENEQTYIGFANPEVLIGMFNELNVDNVVKEVVAALEKVIESSI